MAVMRVLIYIITSIISLTIGLATILAIMSVWTYIAAVVLYAGLTKPGKMGDFFALVSMKSPNFSQKAKFISRPS
jgi:hypothetical protein